MSKLMTRGWAAQLWRGLVVGLLFVLGAPVAAAPVHTAHAAANSSGDTLSLSLANGTTFTYGASTQPIFTVILTLATKPTANYLRIVNVTVDNSQTLTYSNANNPTVSADQLTYTFRVTTTSPYIPASSTPHTAIATYSDPSTGSLQSNSVNFTMAKATPTVECTIRDITTTMDPGQTLHIRIILSLQGSNVQVDQTNRIYTVQFVGPTTVTTAPQQVDSSSEVTVSAPSQYGIYSQVLCIFGGDNLFTPASGLAVGQDPLISRKLALGGVELFTNPTTLVSNQPTDVYVVFHAGAGLPMPTGFFNFEFGYRVSQGLTLGPNGDFLGHTTIPAISGLDHVVISYNGDPYYDWKDFSFPLTNPPIPGSAGSSGSTQGKATATIPAAGTPGAAAATGDDMAPAVTGSNAALASQPGNGGLLWLWAALGVLVLGGGGAAGAMYFVRRSRRAAYSDLGMGVLDGERPGAGVGGNLDGVNRFGSGGGWGDGQG